MTGVETRQTLELCLLASRKCLSWMRTAREGRAAHAVDLDDGVLAVVGLEQVNLADRLSLTGSLPIQSTLHDAGDKAAEDRQL